MVGTGIIPDPGAARDKILGVPDVVDANDRRQADVLGARAEAVRLADPFREAVGGDADLMEGID